MIIEANINSKVVSCRNVNFYMYGKLYLQDHDYNFSSGGYGGFYK